MVAPFENSLFPTKKYHHYLSPENNEYSIIMMMIKRAFLQGPV